VKEFYTHEGTLSQSLHMIPVCDYYRIRCHAGSRFRLARESGEIATIVANYRMTIAQSRPIPKTRAAAAGLLESRWCKQRQGYGSVKPINRLID